MITVEEIQEIYEKQAPEHPVINDYVKWLETELAKRYRLKQKTNTGERCIRRIKSGSYTVIVKQKYVWSGKSFSLAIKMRDLKLKENELKSK